MRTSATGRLAAVRRSSLLGVLGAVALLTGCAATPSALPGPSAPSASHTMPGGESMAGAEHEGHSSTTHEGDSTTTGEAAAATTSGPSEAALMVCEGQVVKAVTTIFALDTPASGKRAWDAPVFTCTYDIDGRPLRLTVHDLEDVAEGGRHFEDLEASHSDATAIKGMAGLGLPSFSTPGGVVAFLRDGKTLTVDATALPDGLGAARDRTQEQVAYSVASAVLTCWVQHD